MNTIKLLAVASGSLLALGIASAGFGQDRPSGYGTSPPTYRPPPSDMPDKAVLKVCKVAGEGVAVGDYWSLPHQAVRRQGKRHACRRSRSRRLLPDHGHIRDGDGGRPL